jgi:hypothetical protein
MAQPTAVERFQPVAFDRAPEVTGCIWRDYGVIMDPNGANVAGTRTRQRFEVWLRTLIQ